MQQQPTTPQTTTPQGTTAQAQNAATNGAPPDFEMVKRRQQAMWGNGDFGAIGTKILICSELLCEAVDIHSGWRVLDVACGHGNTALAAARRGAITTGLDFVPALLERAKERAAAERLQLEWREGDAENLPFTDGAFDAVLSTFGVMFTPNQPRSAQELLRVCRSGGRIGLACWTPESLAGQMFRTIARYMPPPPGLRPPAYWGTEDGIRDLLGDGTREIRIDRRTFVQRFASAEHWLELFRNSFGPVRTAFELLDASGQAELSRDLVDLLRRSDRSGGESLISPMEYLEIVAIRS